MLRDASQRASAVDAPALASCCDAPQHEGEGRDQPAAVRDDCRGNFIASGLLFTMKAATPTCRAGEGPHVTPRCVTIRDIPYVTIRVIMRLDLKPPMPTRRILTGPSHPPPGPRPR